MKVRRMRCIIRLKILWKRLILRIYGKITAVMWRLSVLKSGKQKRTVQYGHRYGF